MGVLLDLRDRLVLLGVSLRESPRRQYNKLYLMSKSNLLPAHLVFRFSSSISLSLSNLTVASFWRRLSCCSCSWACSSCSFSCSSKALARCTRWRFSWRSRACCSTEASDSFSSSATRRSRRSTLERFSKELKVDNRGRMQQLTSVTVINKSQNIYRPPEETSSHLVCDVIVSKLHDVPR